MAGKTTPVLLVTANVGSIFEDPSHMLKIWTEEFLSTVAKLDPKFIALHCQEVGGKNYERSMKHVEDFVRLFMSSEELRLFDKVRVFLDEDYSSAENFTALGNFYFIHESLAEVLLWDFAAMTFMPAKGKEVHSGNIEAVTTKEKSKFPQDFFPECKWSRKGFLRTRWSINGTVFDLINIHLFHDASNFVAMESFPSVYCKNRRRALEHTLERFHNDSYGIAPFFVFGDFNFRTDTQGKLSDGLNAVRIQSNKSNDHTKVQYKDEASQVVLSLGKKEFSHADHQTVFFDENGLWLKEYDRELEAFGGRLFEFAIDFPPSYPFEEDEKEGNNYMKTRCPAWCDRVLLSNTAKNLVNNISAPSCVEYGLMGSNTCMGDHKPVYLKMDLINDAGIVSCCTSCESSSSDKIVLCFGNVLVCETASWSCSSLSLKKSGSAPSALTLKLDTSSPALAADCFLAPPHASLLHEPYTPESMETPTSSPVPLRIQRDFGDLEVDWKCESDDEVLESDLKPGTNSSTEYNLKYTSQSTNENNAFGLSHNSENDITEESSREGLQGCIPHVLICYSDPQERYFNGSKLTCNTNDLNSRHSEPNLSAYSSTSEVGESKLFNPYRIHKEDTKTVSQISLEDLGTSNECSTMSTGVIQDNVCNSSRSCEDNLVSPHSQKTCSSDSGILPSFSCNSSTQSLNETISKEEHSEISRNSNIEGEESSENSNKLLKKKKLEVGNKETSKNVLDTNYLETEIRLHENKANEILTIEDTFMDNCRLTNSSKDGIATNNISVRNSNNDDKHLCQVPEALSSVAHECTTEIIHSSNTDFGVCANVESDAGERKKNPNIPVSSQDSISIVHTEMSSQFKKTKEGKYKTKKTRLKIKNSNCCCIA